MTPKSAEERAREIVERIGNIANRADIREVQAGQIRDIAAALRERDDEVEALRALLAKWRDAGRDLLPDLERLDDFDSETTRLREELAEAKADLKGVQEVYAEELKRFEQVRNERNDLREELEASRAFVGVIVTDLGAVAERVHCMNTFEMPGDMTELGLEMKKARDTLASLPDSARRFLEQHRRMREALEMLSDHQPKGCECQFDQGCMDGNGIIRAALSDGGEGR